MREASLGGAFRLLTRPCLPAISLKTRLTGSKRKVAVLHASGADCHSPSGCRLADRRDHATALRRRRPWNGRGRIGAGGPVLAPRRREHPHTHHRLPGGRILHHQHDVNPDVSGNTRKQPAAASGRAGRSDRSRDARRPAHASEPSDRPCGTWGRAGSAWRRCPRRTRAPGYACASRAGGGPPCEVNLLVRS